MIPRRLTRTIPGQHRALARGLLWEPVGAVGELETALAGYMSVPEVVLTSSGRQALLLLLEALDLPRGARILFPALTLRALLDRVEAAGYRPVVVDVAPGSWGMCPVGAESTASQRGCDVIVATHLFGQPSPVEGLGEVAKRHGALLVEDCAHALGARVADHHVGRAGAGSLFSFESIKNLNTFGGGCVVTGDGALASRVRARLAVLDTDRGALARKVAWALGMDLLMRSPLYSGLAIAMSSEHVKATLSRAYLSARDASIPHPTRIHPAQAGVGLRMLAEMETMNARCRAIEQRYRRALDQTLRFQEPTPGGQASGYFITATAPVEPRWLQRRLALRGIDIGIGAEIVDDCSDYTPESACPTARVVSSGLIQLPGHHLLGDREIDQVITSVQELTS